MGIEYKCFVCTSIYFRDPSIKNTKYCSRLCQNRYQAKMNGIKLSKKIRHNCGICNKEFYQKLSRKNVTFCSRLCKQKDWKINGAKVSKKIKYNCVNCTKECLRKPSKTDARFCSIKCRSIVNSKEKQFWSVATKEQKKERMKISYDKFVIRRSNNECWGWKGAKSGGYGSFGFGATGRTIKAHRAAWLLYRGEIPKGKIICHHCDNPECSNYFEHLYLGTHQSNSDDMIKRKRNADLSGEKHPLHILIESQVKEIKKQLLLGKRIKDIAQQFNVNRCVIDSIKADKNWKKVTI